MKCYADDCNNPPTLTCLRCGNYACNQHKGKHPNYSATQYICLECFAEIERELQTSRERARIAQLEQQAAVQRAAEEAARRREAYANELIECPRCSGSRHRKFFAIFTGCPVCGGTGHAPRRKVEEYIRAHPEPDPEPDSSPPDTDPWSHGASWKSINNWEDW